MGDSPDLVFLRELRIAHELLTADSKKKEGRRWPDKSFETFCKDIGISKSTAYNLLRTYFPDYCEACGLGARLEQSSVAFISLN